VGQLTRIREFGARYIDYSMAWKGALFLAVAVWLINLEHGAIAALPAALKQAAYTYFVAGFVVRLCENIAVRIENRRLALFLAVLVPSTIALGLTLLVHTLKGTPEPLRSVLPTLLTAPPAFFWWGRRNRAQRDGVGGVPSLEASRSGNEGFDRESEGH
jgi:hypothetical protein